MPTSAEVWLVDTSVAVALVSADHASHEAVFSAVGERSLGLAGHAAFETFSVLTRLPPPARRSPSAVATLLANNFPHSRFLSPRRAAALLRELPGRAIAGGSVYDALVAATSIEHGLPLVSRDRRSLPTYRELGAEVVLLA